MAEFPEALGAALAARYGWGEPKRPASHRQGLKARMSRIQRAVGGGQREAADAAGIPASTWRDWTAGRRNPSPRNLRKLESAFARIVIAPATAAAIARKGYPDIWAVTAVVVADPEGQRYINGYKRKRGQAPPSKEEVYNLTAPPAYRTFKADGLNGRHIVDSWIHHGDHGAAQAFANEVERRYGEPFGFEGPNVRVDI